MTAGARCHSDSLRCADGLPLGLDLWLPAEAAGPLPLVLLCHGFKGFRRWGMFPHIAESLAAGGRAVALFDLTHNGTAPGSEQDFTRLDLFERQTLSRHVADLLFVLESLREPHWSDEHALLTDAPWLVGHSLGGGVAILAAAAEPSVAGVVTLNGVSHVQRIPAAARAQLAERGHVIIPNARTGQDMPLGTPWFEDADRTDLAAAARSLACPALVLAGSADSVVPPDEARALGAWIPRARLEFVTGADHTFCARHPWQGLPPELARALALLDQQLPARLEPYAHAPRA